jgi:hypothetical protein
LQANKQPNDNDETQNEAWKKNKASYKQISNKITMTKHRMKFEKRTKLPKINKQQNDNEKTHNEAQRKKLHANK